MNDNGKGNSVETSSYIEAQRVLLNLVFLFVKEVCSLLLIHAASRIYAAYIAVGRVQEGAGDQWMERSIVEAVRLAVQIDNHVDSDGEMR